MMRSGKHNARRTWFKGRWFQSKAEAARYGELLILEAAGEVWDLECQPKFELVPAFRDGWTGKRVRPLTYSADFRYKENANVSGERFVRTVIEDVKGHPTELFKAKWKMLLWQYRDDPTLSFRIVRAKEVRT